jgi:competence transcription factor ComK
MKVIIIRETDMISGATIVNDDVFLSVLHAFKEADKKCLFRIEHLEIESNTELLDYIKSENKME